MNIDYPLHSQTDDLRNLFQEAFGDTEAFLDVFYTHGFNSDRCRCITQDGQVVAALYWFDCSLQGRPVAYLYAIATKKSHRGKGLCRALLENTHHHLKYLGYDGCILVPGDEKLARMYEKIGYNTCSNIMELFCVAAQQEIPLRRIDAEEYFSLRRTYLPRNSVVQEGDCIPFFQNLARFYAGEDFLVAVSRTEASILELLGNSRNVPEILASLRLPKAKIRMPGNGKKFGMYHPLSNLPGPTYFGLAFD